ncbi:MAG: hypothetical protein JO149_04115 [Gammaproteobacteria bacterium]|nr:hypothetical protein [Gammaproteobacteria bacterium]
MVMNLLPWREREKTYQTKVIKQFFLLTGTTIFFFLWLMHWIIAKNHERLLNEVAQLQEELTYYSPSHPEKTAVMTTLSSALIHHQKVSKDFLLALGKKAANPICFTEISHHENHVTFIGKARSLMDLTDYLLNWQPAYLFSEIKIHQLQQAAEGVQFSFLAEESV